MRWDRSANDVPRSGPTACLHAAPAGAAPRVQLDSAVVARRVAAAQAAILGADRVALLARRGACLVGRELVRPQLIGAILIAATEAGRCAATHRLARRAARRVAGLARRRAACRRVARAVAARLAALATDGRHVLAVAAHRLAALPPSRSSLVRVELVRGALLVRRATALAGDLALPFRVHRGEATPALPFAPFCHHSSACWGRIDRRRRVPQPRTGCYQTVLPRPASVPVAGPSGLQTPDPAAQTGSTTPWGAHLDHYIAPHVTRRTYPRHLCLPPDRRA